MFFTRRLHENKCVPFSSSLFRQGAIGDGSAIVTDSAAIHEKLKQLGNYGQTDRYTHELAGMNSRFDETRATILDEKLKQLDANDDRRRQIAGCYRSTLKVVTPLAEADYGLPCYHLFVIRAAGRDTLSGRLQQAGIGTLIHYPVPLHQQKAFVPTRAPACPQAENFTRAIFSIPCYPQLTHTKVEMVADCINNNT